MANASTNPVTILSFVAVFAGCGLGASPDYLAASALAGGVFIGSALWWLLLSSGVALFRSRIDSGWMLAVNRLSGGVIFVFGIYPRSAGDQGASRSKSPKAGRSEYFFCHGVYMKPRTSGTCRASWSQPFTWVKSSAS